MSRGTERIEIKTMVDPAICEQIDSVAFEGRIDRQTLLYRAIAMYLNAWPGLRAGHVVGVASPEDLMIHTQILLDPMPRPAF